MRTPMTFDELTERIKIAKSGSDIREAWKLVNFEALDGNLTVTQEARLRVALIVMTKAMAAHTWWGRERMVAAFAYNHRDLWGGGKDGEECALEYFSEVAIRQESRVIAAKAKADLAKLFVNKPKLSAVIIDGRLLEGGRE